MIISPKSFIMYAVIKTGGKQYLVQKGSVLKIEKLEGEVGGKVDFREVLMTFSDDGVTLDIGNPFLSKATVSGVIQEQGRGKKVTIIKYKPKVRYRRKTGHHQLFTKVEITNVK